MVSNSSSNCCNLCFVCRIKKPLKSPNVAAGDENIILNPSFDDGLNNWEGRGCNAVIHDTIADGNIVPMSGKFFASATGRSQAWNGLQQDITGRVQRKLLYNVSAVVRIFGNNISSSNVSLTLYSQTPDSREQYIGIARYYILNNSFSYPEFNLL